MVVGFAGFDSIFFFDFCSIALGSAILAYGIAFAKFDHPCAGIAEGPLKEIPIEAPIGKL